MTEASRPDVTFVVCVESGRYEAMAVRMVESLRLFGGSYAAATVIAITPRLGPPLARGTRTRFQELGVTHVRRRHLRRSWNRFIGKVWGLGEIERLASTEIVVLVDCDILFMGEPNALTLPPGVDVAVCHPDSGIIGTTGPDSIFENAWRHACAAVGLRIDDLPWVEPYDGSDPVRFYVNSGVVVFRRGCGLPQRWLQFVDALLDEHVLFPEWGDYFADQIALALAIVYFGFPWTPLPYSHNFGVANMLPNAWSSPDLASARILHYHDQLLREHWDNSLDRLRRPHPEVTSWLQAQPPIDDSVTTSARIIRFTLRIPRAATRRFHRLRGWLARHRSPTAEVEMTKPPA